MTSKYEMDGWVLLNESDFIQLLHHWKDARDSGKLSPEEINENLRCTMDLVGMIQDHFEIPEHLWKKS